MFLPNLVVNTRHISAEEGEKLAHEKQCLFIETSPRTGYNVKQLFLKIANALPGVGEDDGGGGSHHSKY